MQRHGFARLYQQVVVNGTRQLCWHTPNGATSAALTDQAAGHCATHERCSRRRGEEANVCAAVNFKKSISSKSTSKPYVETAIPEPSSPSASGSDRLLSHACR